MTAPPDAALALAHVRAPARPRVPTHSAIYRGWVRHRRRGTPSHEFRYRLSMLYLDLDELPRAFDGRWLWSVERSNVVSVRRADYLGDPAQPLDEAVRDVIEAELGFRPDGAVRMLTQPRTFGLVFNPVTFYYAFAAGDDRDPVALVAEITNTPWGERHRYVLDGRGGSGLAASFPKRFHVSPFFDMDHEYVWRFWEPGERLSVHMQNLRDGERVFDASLHLEREPLTGSALARGLLAHPFMAAKIVAGIYWQAARLWLKRARFHPHPARATARSRRDAS